MRKTSRLTAVIIIGAVFIVAGYHTLAAASGVSTAPATMSQVTQALVPHPPSRTVWAGVYTQEQAARGGLAYQQFCSRCHSNDLSGGEAGPQLSGSAFFNTWDGLTLFGVFAKIQSSMPHDYAVFIPADSTRDIVSFLLKENGVPAGDKELSADIENLRDILIIKTPASAK